MGCTGFYVPVFLWVRRTLWRGLSAAVTVLESLNGPCGMDRMSRLVMRRLVVRYQASWMVWHSCVHV